MKHTKLILLGLITGLSLVACNKSDYILCSKIEVGTKTYTSGYTTHQIVAKYRSDSPLGFGGEKEADDGYYYNYFCASFKGDIKDPKFPKEAVYQRHSYGSTTSYQISLVKEIGKYESYGYFYLAKNKKTIKFEEALLKPRNGSSIDEILGQVMRVLPLDPNQEINTWFSSDGDLIEFSSKQETTYITVEGEVTSYTVIEK